MSEVIVAFVFAAAIVAVDSIAVGARRTSFLVGAVAVGMYSVAATLRTLDQPKKLKALASMRAMAVGLMGLATVLALIGLAVGV